MSYDVKAILAKIKADIGEIKYYRYLEILNGFLIGKVPKTLFNDEIKDIFPKHIKYMHNVLSLALLYNINITENQHLPMQSNENIANYNK